MSHVERAVRFIETLTLPDGRPLAETLPRDPWLVRDVIVPILAQSEDGLPRHWFAWIELVRGSAKTSIAGAAIALAEAILEPGTLVVAFASDYDQAAELAGAIEGQRRRNPKLAKALKKAQDGFEVRNTGSRIRIMSSDAPSAYGLAADARRLRVVCDELTQWAKRDLFDAALTTLPKVKDSQIVVLTNAGIVGSWQEEARTQFEGAGGYVYAPGGIVASWTDRDEVERLRHVLPLPVYQRFYEGIWITSGASFMSADELDAIFTQVEPMREGDRFIGIDIGTSRDRTAVALARANGDPVRVQVQQLHLWEGEPGRRVQITDVEETVLAVAQVEQVRRIVLDPYQGLQLAERLRAKGFVTEEYSFSDGLGRDRLFQSLLELVQQRRLRAMPHPVLRQELEGLKWTVRRGRVRPDHPTGGHDDSVIAVALAAHAAVEASVIAQEEPLVIDGITYLPDENGRLMEADRNHGRVPRDATHQELAAAGFTTDGSGIYLPPGASWRRIN